jgi:hypothetical protein
VWGIQTDSIIKLARPIMEHTNNARSSQSAFLLNKVLGFVKETGTKTVAKDLKPGESVWEAVGMSISRIVEEGSKLLPLILENENVIKSKLSLPFTLVFPFQGDDLPPGSFCIDSPHPFPFAVVIYR